MSIISWIEAIEKRVPEGTVSTVLIFILILGTVVEIVPVKIKPWSWIVKKIGKIANEDVLNRLGIVEKDICDLKAKNEEQDEKRMERDAVIARREILRFGDSLSHGVVYSRDSYSQIMVDIDDYEEYCNTHPSFKNSMTKSATKKILSDFERRDTTNDFLK